MNCTNYKDRLLDLALGASAPEELLVHLRACPACAAQLERQRQLVAAMDRGVELSVAAEPSPQLLARVRTRLAEEPSPSRGWFSGWMPVAAGAVAVAALLMFLLLPRETSRPSNAPPAANRAAVEKPAVAPRGAAASPGAVATSAPPKLPGKRLAKMSKPALRETAPEVLVPQDEREGVRYLVAAIERRKMDPSKLLDWVPAKKDQSEPLTLAELEIPPLEITPLGQDFRSQRPVRNPSESPRR